MKTRVCLIYFFHDYKFLTALFKNSMKQKNVASLLKHINDFCE